MTTPKSSAERIILGIDPGTNVMGYGVLRVVGNKPQMLALGVVDMRKLGDPYLKLGKVFERVVGIIDAYHPDEMAIEAPFYSKNVQSLIKLGRAQGVAIAAAIHRDIFIHEYAPLKIKMAITGQGQASKAQVAGMLQRLLHISKEDMPRFMDATDALGAAWSTATPKPDISSWKAVITTVWATSTAIPNAITSPPVISASSLLKPPICST